MFLFSGPLSPGIAKAPYRDGKVPVVILMSVGLTIADLDVRTALRKCLLILLRRGEDRTLAAVVRPGLCPEHTQDIQIRKCGPLFLKKSQFFRLIFVRRRGTRVRQRVHIREKSKIQNINRVIGCDKPVSVVIRGLIQRIIPWHQSGIK